MSFPLQFLIATLGSILGSVLMSFAQTTQQKVAVVAMFLLPLLGILVYLKRS